MVRGQDVAVGSTIGDRYRIEALIGRGGMAAVYRARDESLGRRVAIKVIEPAADASAVQRGRSEVELLASLNHHALVTLFDAGVFASEGGERTCLIMELVDGPNLGTRIAEGPLARNDIAHMASDLSEALHVVHAQGVVHRDIKPANVLLAASALPTHEFTAKLADFGIAHLIDSTRVTAAGTMVGTAAFLSPEQALGSAPGPASDIYSLGLVLLESLTGDRAFPGSLVESVTARLARDPEIPAELGDEWSTLLRAMTAREPDARPTALEVAVAARAIEHNPLNSGESTVAMPVRLPAAATEVMGSPAASDDSGGYSQNATRLLPVAGAEQTELLQRPTPAQQPPTVPRPAHDGFAALAPAGVAAVASRWSRTRLVIAGAAVILVVVVLAVSFSAASNNDAASNPAVSDPAVSGPTVSEPAASEPTTPATTLPTVADPMGTHLQELLDSVTP